MTVVNIGGFGNDTNRASSDGIFNNEQYIFVKKLTEATIIWQR